MKEELKKRLMDYSNAVRDNPKTIVIGAKEYMELAKELSACIDDFYSIPIKIKDEKGIDFSGDSE